MRQENNEDRMKVYLIGAGPGDPGLLTIKGKDILEKADVVVYDYLANDTLLGYARPDAERIYVGKVAGNHALPQDGINKLIIEKAKEGKIVARLKGGDPYIFGRGGEEAEELLDAGVPFEEVPGISSTIAGPAYAGIPLTHRSFSSSVTLITGHENPDKPGSVHNWKALAASANTLVFVMGMKNLPDIARNLIEAGLSPDTPAALVHWGTTAKHRSLASTLGTLHEEGVRQGFTNPSVIIVGKVVTLRDRLNWFEQKPLLGRSVVVTRAREQASGLAAQLADHLHGLGLADAGIEVVHVGNGLEGSRHFLRRKTFQLFGNTHVIIELFLFFRTDVAVGGGDDDRGGNHAVQKRPVAKTAHFKHQLVAAFLQFFFQRIQKSHDASPCLWREVPRVGKHCFPPRRNDQCVKSARNRSRMSSCTAGRVSKA